LSALVTAIMPTRGRPEMSRAAVECWRGQVWPKLELVIVDDRDCPSFPAEDFTGYRIRYTKLSERLTVGEKRNVACSMASGEIIVHFDSDDWSAPGRIADQVARLQATGKQVTGYSGMLFHETRKVRVLDVGGFRAAGAWWRWRGMHGQAAGTSLCYRRDWWLKHPFLPEQRAEDDLFYAEALRLGEAVSVDGRDLMCAVNHGDCVSERLIGGAEWEELPEGPYEFQKTGGAVLGDRIEETPPTD